FAGAVAQRKQYLNGVAAFAALVRELQVAPARTTVVGRPEIGHRVVVVLPLTADQPAAQSVQGALPLGGDQSVVPDPVHPHRTQLRSPGTGPQPNIADPVIERTRGVTLPTRRRHSPRFQGAGAHPLTA